MAEKFMLSPFGTEHEIFRQQCRRFVEKELAPHAREWKKKQDFPDEVFRRVGEMGLHGILIPEEYGGIGGRLPDGFGAG